MNDVHVDCATCGITFCLPANLHARRRRDGADFYCPNGHSNVYRETVDQKRIKELEEDIASWRESHDYLREANDELYASREELIGVVKECPFGCGFRSRRQVPRDPVSMGRGIERVKQDLRDHLLLEHRAQGAVQKLLEERTS